jgi:hypothetical protein
MDALYESFAAESAGEAAGAQHAASRCGAAYLEKCRVIPNLVGSAVCIARRLWPQRVRALIDFLAERLGHETAWRV